MSRRSAEPGAGRTALRVAGRSADPRNLSPPGFGARRVPHLRRCAPRSGRSTVRAHGRDAVGNATTSVAVVPAHPPNELVDSTIVTTTALPSVTSALAKGDAIQVASGADHVAPLGRAHERDAAGSRRLTHRESTHRFRSVSDPAPPQLGSTRKAHHAGIDLAKTSSTMSLAGDHGRGSVSSRRTADK